MKLARNTKGFTLVEIMIVVAIIGLLAAIAVPNFVQARTTARTNACINNLRLISAAKDQAAMENNLPEDVDLTSAQITPYLKGNVLPTCPAQGTYAILAPNTNPTCDQAGHKLP